MSQRVIIYVNKKKNFSYSRQMVSDGWGTFLHNFSRHQLCLKVENFLGMTDEGQYNES